MFQYNMCRKLLQYYSDAVFPPPLVSLLGVLLFMKLSFQMGLGKLPASVNIKPMISISTYDKGLKKVNRSHVNPHKLFHIGAPDLRGTAVQQAAVMPDCYAAN